MKYNNEWEKFIIKCNTTQITTDGGDSFDPNYQYLLDKAWLMELKAYQQGREDMKQEIIEMLSQAQNDPLEALKEF